MLAILTENKIQEWKLYVNDKKKKNRKIFIREHVQEKDVIYPLASSMNLASLFI